MSLGGTSAGSGAGTKSPAMQLSRSMLTPGGAESGRVAELVCWLPGPSAITWLMLPCAATCGVRGKLESARFTHPRIVGGAIDPPYHSAHRGFLPRPRRHAERPFGRAGISYPDPRRTVLVAGAKFTDRGQGRVRDGKRARRAEPLPTDARPARTAALGNETSDTPDVHFTEPSSLPAAHRADVGTGACPWFPGPRGAAGVYETTPAEANLPRQPALALFRRGERGCSALLHLMQIWRTTCSRPESRPSQGTTPASRAGEGTTQ